MMLLQNTHDAKGNPGCRLLSISGEEVICVGDARFELATSPFRTTRATNCANPRGIVFCYVLMPRIELGTFSLRACSAPFQ